MASNRVRLEDLRILLEGLGFAPTRRTSAHLVFRRTRGDGITIVLPTARIVAPPMLAYVRRALEEDGVLGRNEFDQRLQPQ
jgi:hypothetical protein